ncbi:hypothetical protein L1280_002291 [Deinococcus sp. HSC-46F16]|uniref:hypothetical protein n=1 Tax=Deinococcus sp. HSC-46F16 TaxID=2910968 RepID=UPI0020A10C28|nr:hypothetical protein [Deinococcus sp. HSC-46F16]MCP2015130.1 hypothetical protein [Deinococcus sp. HSC-46F16]
MTALAWLMVAGLVVLAILLSGWLARQSDLPLGRLLLGLTGVYLLAGVAVTALWNRWPGQGNTDAPIGYLLVGALALLPRLAEVPAVRVLRPPARWGVTGLGLVLPVLGLMLGAALLRPQALEMLTELLLWSLGVAAALAVLAALWQGLERVWVLPTGERQIGVDNPDERPPPGP